MKLSYNWLIEYLHCKLSPQQIAEAMTSIGIEVDGVEEQEQVPYGLAGVVVAKVVECQPHPDSDHLHITKVDDGSGELLTVVCGAPNVAQGQKVLFARIGTILPGEFKIKKSKIRGVESFGMICAEDELGIGESHNGIMVLPDSAVIGTSAKEYLGLKTEAVIEYEITANRVDAASHIGVARDLYAYLKLNNIDCKLEYPRLQEIQSSNDKAYSLDIQNQEVCPRYVGVTIKGVKVGPSPKWLQSRLVAIGLNPINNIVDISNYVMFELGQPLHIFDADKIDGDKVVVRLAKDGEDFRTLDGIDRKLKNSDIVIADANKPMCLAGVFGGEYSGVSDNTVNIFIESAYFNPGYIRSTSKAHGLQTDSSFRFERGANIDITRFAANRAVDLVLELAGGKVVGSICEFYPNKAEKACIKLDYNYIEQFIGKKIGHSVIENILTYLGYEFVEKCEAGATVLAPLYMVDVTRQCDVVEEILRIYGYNNIELPSSMRMSVSSHEGLDLENLKNYISNFLVANGFVETMNNSLTKVDYYAKSKTYPLEKCVNIVNPLSADLGVMRQTLLFNGLEVLAYNINRQISSIRTFEFGSVYSKDSQKDCTKLEAYTENTCLSLFMTGSSDKSWVAESQKSSYYILKGYVDLLLSRYGVEVYTLDMKDLSDDIFDEGLSYCLPNSGKEIVKLGVVRNTMAKSFGIKQAVFAAEFNWEVLVSLVKRVNVKFKELPKFPEVRRDLALLLDENIRFADLRKSAIRVGKKILKSVALIDVYRGDKIPQDKKQYVLSFVLQDLDKTLTDNEVEKVMSKLLSTFQNEFGAILR